MSVIKSCVFLITIANVLRGSTGDQVCINKNNKRCQNVGGKLDLIIVACGEHLRVNDGDDVDNTCTFLENCSDHPKNMKCMVSNTMIDCYHCIHRTAMLNYRTNHEKAKAFGEVGEQGKENPPEETSVPRNLSLSQVVIQSFGMLAASVFLFAIHRGRTVRAIVPCVILLITNLLGVCENIVLII